MSSPLVIKDYTKRYGKDIGVEQVSLEVTEGEVFGFLGPNGAGKTTTIRTILDFIRPTSGTISVFGKDSVRDSVSIKSDIGYLAGDIALYEDMTGRQLLDYLTTLNRNTDWKYVARLAKLLQAQLDRPIKKLSKGNKQKIGLIQAFMHHPKLILLDEPTSGLDPLMQQVFYELVEEAKEDGMTVFISSHNLQEVQRLCDRVAFIRKGRLIAVEDLSKDKTINYRRYRVEFRKPPKQSELSKIKAVSEVHIQGKRAVVGIAGSPNDFIKAIGSYDITDFSEEESSLEDVFMHYYSEEDNA